ncbi:MAG: hypothetical protein UU40_C0002G0004 [Candidatus Uhrbacteria bacterium GW2011_GWD2_41_121]|uniref:Natural resistance-associated macrophage protein n=1 Tax=Candidatus Uhrbacteria bacterium GW2011_GWC1_41_20 TaxID=1618983 RepID=A0A0G0YHK0_9BACT|nr:MAG: hypothetical protein UT52_C0002G0004 [Candidatus Uhrbacteria bacterium GW2011_GWE1_39_46]KKR64487.1 MAG: hypothetical protein UU04_C0001G0004 [Candidatus Uhrbacteria bacterium GW2011_GWC2_40_450]KKR90330.1 MAG: hypothetical protein UU36_C0007G0002 [Candidatus Uhrbacteria bacterium GW2011_GWE2_41_1153]KKR90559.1 MAG: hypothetical protein UU40_C0002G0004 [Candidatus Uhrbacteria bacterium GW2011_GWD2_41_121]KKR96470.1 MAG: hypothetical protein UU46_C0002G0006 [Candidatus Uhrbacteria bacter
MSQLFLIYLSHMKKFPKALPIKKLFGPSFLILALGLGSGEIILWPYLASNYGLGIAWGALLGITFQYFINMEIERYALVKGESVFVGINKFWKKAPIWFIGSTFLGFGLPGIIAASAQVFASILGMDNFKWIAIIFLLIIGLILSSGKTVYGMLERITKTILLIGVPFIFIIVFFLADASDWTTLVQGFIGQGDGYLFIPEGIVLATFLGAFAYAGAGGNLNLTQSIYIKEKGYGMGKYAQKLAGLFRSSKKIEKIRLEGYEFAETKESYNNFKTWWKRISIEHLLVFWFMGALSICLLMILSYTTVFGMSGVEQGIGFVILEGSVIATKLGPWVGIVFLFAVAIMLFQTQLGVMDSTSRIMAENASLKTGNHNLSKLYSIFVWSQIAFGIILFLFNITEPKTLIVIGACINAFAMAVHIGLVSILNQKSLSKLYRASWWRKVIIGIIFLFFSVFSLVVLYSQF